MNELTSLSHEELLCFIRSAPASIFFKDIQCRYRFVSDLCGLVHGSAAEDLLGRTDLEVQSDPALGRECYEEDLHILASGQGSHRVSRFPLPSGPVYLEIKKNPVRLHGAVIGIIGVINDITQQVTQERELKELSFRDKLTGLYNRNYLETRMRHYVRADDFPASLIMADCNYLKRVNDTLGHEYGDLLLKRTARIIRSALPAGCTALRLGGDEFMILCEGCDAQQAEALVENIQSRFAKESDDRIPLSAAFGAHTTGTGEFLFAEAYRCADRAMYENKRKMQAAPPAQEE